MTTVGARINTNLFAVKTEKLISISAMLNVKMLIFAQKENVFKILSSLNRIIGNRTICNALSALKWIDQFVDKINRDI